MSSRYFGDVAGLKPGWLNSAAWAGPSSHAEKKSTSYSSFFSTGKQKTKKQLSAIKYWYYEFWLCVCYMSPQVLIGCHEEPVLNAVPPWSPTVDNTGICHSSFVLMLIFLFCIYCIYIDCIVLSLFIAAFFVDVSCLFIYIYRIMFCFVYCMCYISVVCILQCVCLFVCFTNMLCIYTCLN